MEDRVAAKRIAKAMRVSEKTVYDRATDESWPFVEEKGRGRGGKRRLYPVATLPQVVRSALSEAPLVAALPADPDASIRRETPRPLPPVKCDTIQKWQRECRDARLVILAEIDRMAALEGVERALEHFVALARSGELNEVMTRAVAAANARKGTRAALSASTLRGWRRAMAGGGPDALIPGAKPKKAMPNWLPAFLKRYRIPTKPSVAWCYEKMIEAGEGADLPCLRDVQRRIKGLGLVEANRGRMGPRELKRLMAYVKRDFSDLLPTDIYTGDGHTADMEVRHPEHGRPFRPEITSILDVATRKCVGWSVGLAESSWGVADALRRAVEYGGIGAIFYADRGSGFRNHLLEGPALGILARVGTQHEHSIPYNSQARGIIEAYQKFWIREAKAFPFYVGKDMDKEARHTMFVRTRAEVKELGFAKSLMPWDAFVAWVEDRVAYYNNHPHSSLPTIRDPQSGKKRHMTPNEQWAALAPQAEIIMEEQHVLDDLFRPYVVTEVKRCLVKVLGKEYYNKPALTHYHGQEVMVGYDVRDPSQVWIRDLDERPICVAMLDGNAQPYFPKSVMEEAREKRAKGRLDRLARKEAEVLAELHGGQPALDVSPLSDAQLLRHEQTVREFEAANVTCMVSAREKTETARDRFRRALDLERRMAAGEGLSPEDGAWLARFRTSTEYRAEAMLYEDFGDAMFG